MNGVLADHDTGTVARDRLRALVAARVPDHSLEQAFYADPDVFAWDLEAVWASHWLYAGHVSQIPRAGDYFLYQFGTESIVVIRGRDGAVRAHHNVCRHRGSRLLLEEHGHANKIICPYHAWTYDDRGSLVACMHMPPDFDKTLFGLLPVHVRVAEGLIYVCTGAAPPDFQPFADDLAHFLADFDLAEAKIAHHARYEVACNWKLLGENFSECYHCGKAHPEYTAKVMYAAATAHPNSIAHAAWQETEAAANAHFAGCGIGSGHRERAWYYCGRQAMRPGFVSMSADGQQLAPLLGRLRDPDAGNFCFFARPNSICEASSDHAVLLQFSPLAPKRTRADVYWLVRADAEAGRDYQEDDLIWFWKTTAEQDWDICADNQAGVDSAAYRPGPYSLVERSVEKYVLWYLAALDANGQ
jgi:Rieske 2Fe-2S family protein